MRQDISEQFAGKLLSSPGVCRIKQSADRGVHSPPKGAIVLFGKRALKDDHHNELLARVQFQLMI
ncbi:MAG: hypothetical protein M3O30_09760 [Planctomycetota bacterium]|nr:hypothetical protein [Planctomycetota bacterium]